MSAGERRGRAASAADAADQRLRDRTYAVPFEQVWQAALRLAGGRLRGWKTTAADDHEGVISAVARSIGGREHDVTVRIGLDADAQTHVTAEVVAREAGMDFGRAERRLRRFLCALDKAVLTVRAAGRGQ